MEPLNVLMIGTGEYTTGFVGGGASASDKKVGVVALTMFDLRRRGKVSSRLGMAGVNGTKFPAIREHLRRNISDVYAGMDTSFTSFPGDAECDPLAYRTAIDTLSPGDAVTIFTPDPKHLEMALYAVDRGVHVLVTKPAVQRLEDHQELLRRARAKGVYVFVEHHKRFDPAYADARHRARALGAFNYFYAYMAQPKYQLRTFAAWAGTDSDISYYLNSHHVDVCDSMVRPLGYRPARVSAASSLGIATGSLGCRPGTEDTITLMVTWVRDDGERRDGGESSEADATAAGAGAGAVTTPPSRAVGVFTASWTAPERAGVHTSQHFHYLAQGGEIRVDQARRGYDIADDEGAGQVQWLNPFYMRYAPDEDGHFAGQTGYGYVSLEKFVDGCRAVNAGKQTARDLDTKDLPTLANTIATTAILEAGRRSLDEGGREVAIVVEGGSWKLV